ncbi:hypothetical protein BD626DRAFT_629617 [Schizophyllum amplum]|uniref:Uncharacterized protein n=1 Tax=Schizophyllum amplum TaxID=97359 RepID=A0A550CGD4_9AGAR|nr:hypothetical protein BD626DRAFT_629617 [Auriculariopsis ampla]
MDLEARSRDMQERTFCKWPRSCRTSPMAYVSYSSWFVLGIISTPILPPPLPHAYIAPTNTRLACRSPPSTPTPRPRAPARLRQACPTSHSPLPISPPSARQQGGEREAQDHSRSGTQPYSAVLGYVPAHLCAGRSAPPPAAVPPALLLPRPSGRSRSTLHLPRTYPPSTLRLPRTYPPVSSTLRLPRSPRRRARGSFADEGRSRRLEGRVWRISRRGEAGGLPGGQGRRRLRGAKGKAFEEGEGPFLDEERGGRPSRRARSLSRTRARGEAFEEGEGGGPRKVSRGASLEEGRGGRPSTAAGGTSIDKERASVLREEATRPPREVTTRPLRSLSPSASPRAGSGRHRPWSGRHRPSSYLRCFQFMARREGDGATTTSRTGVIAPSRAMG